MTDPRILELVDAITKSCARPKDHATIVWDVAMMARLIEEFSKQTALPEWKRRRT